MERLESMVPVGLKRAIYESTTEDLISTCSALHESFLNIPEFRTILGELNDPEMGLCRKSSAEALKLKNKGNQFFVIGDYEKASSFYSQALRFVPMSAHDMDKDFVAVLYVNRASSLHNLGLLEECIHDCNRAVVLSLQYAKAWYRRGKANASLGNYRDAINDMEIALSMEGSLSGKKRIKDELEDALNHSKSTHGTSRPSKHSYEKNLGCAVEPQGVQLECVSTPDKGRGMASCNNIQSASLVHREEPYAAIVSKQCRETHCHFCFNRLPADFLACSSCTKALYCSTFCRNQAEGKEYPDLESHLMDIVLANMDPCIVDVNLQQNPEHRHECGGVHWPFVLPSEVVLAGRVLVKLFEKRKAFTATSESIESLDLVHNYPQMSPESKLESHIYSLVLLYCLQSCSSLDFTLSGSSIAQVVVLISQIKINSMAIVHMISVDAHGALKSEKHSVNGNSLTCILEQVRVGQAVYLRGSLFNHSCQPNLHSYFLSRILHIRTTEFVPAGIPLELSYGPQIGQLDLQQRQQMLKDQYAFNCQCNACSELNLSDLVIHAFCCVTTNCRGVVLETEKVNRGRLASSFLQDYVAPCIWELPMPACEEKKNAIREVAQLLLKRPTDMPPLQTGHCLCCGSYHDLESSNKTAKETTERIDLLTSNQMSSQVISSGLKSLNLMRSVRHAYSKDVAQAEDIISEALCSFGEFRQAVDHCKASVEILEKIYHPNHIAIGNELVKLTSIQLLLGDHDSTLDNVNRLDAIFSLHYGAHATKIFPYLESIKRECDRHAH
ncbi:hypothetical protein QJS04_geneDACA001961 [Acorus gramineus]|uniref:SET domain-containing protein n=1 Tax=Acorus gramineus TaxID=55184 RepID=A0AAV9A9L0_ACOGR|nr:hypothetical protein QJS04_geneDACA001961 [Acorus gramineus]